MEIKSKLKKVALVAPVVAAGVFAVPVMAGAAVYDPSSDLSTLGSATGTSAGPDIVEVATDMIGVAILLWGIRFVYHFFGQRGK